MTFNFARRLDDLEVFFNQMRKLNVEIGTFKYKYNEVESDVIFDVRNKKGLGWKLVFIKLGVGATLEIPVLQGYRFAINSSNKYQAFREYFDIKGGRGQFKLGEFVDLFSICIPHTYQLTDEKREKVMKYDPIDNKSTGIYPIGIINWEVKNVRKSPDDTRHRTAENLAKTKQLYPDTIYKYTKNMDISIKYGEEKGNKTDSILSNNLD